MNEFRFHSPQWLFLLLLLPMAGLALARFNSDAKRKLLRFLSDTNLAKLLVSKGTLRDRGRRWAFWAGLTLLVLAVARPQANPTTEEVQSAGLDIYVLMDVSRSMDAEDVAPSRLKKAKRTVQHLTERLSGDRVGIIAYANSAVLVSPLTSDYSIIENYLKSVDTSMIPSQGTDLGQALEVAREAMDRGARSKGAEGERSNIFIVMSDGEDHGDADLAVVDAIRKSGGLVFTIAIGTERGAPIPLRDDKGELRGFKTDAAKNTVVSMMNPKVLKEVANKGGGVFYFSTLQEEEVEDLLARVSNAQRGSYAVVRTTVYEEWFALFLTPALLLLLFSFVSVRDLSLASLARAIKVYVPKRRLKMAMKGVLLAASLGSSTQAEAGLLSFLYSKEKKASETSGALAREKKFDEAVDTLKGLQAENPDSGDLNYNIGTYQVKGQKHEQGREQLSRLRSADDNLRLPAFFNIGGSYAQEQKKDEARAAYAELIQLLKKKQKLSASESKLLELAKQNVARLADPAQQPPPPEKSKEQQKQDGGGGGGQGQKDKEKKEDKSEGKSQGEGENKKDNAQSGQDQKKEDPKDGKKEDKKDEKKEEEQKKNSQENGKDQQSQGGEQPKDGGQLPPRRGRQPFKERDNMGEDDAKRILGALKDREGDLQKKFLKDQLKGGKVNVDDAAKDW